MIPHSRPKLLDLYTPSQSKLLENYTIHSGTYLYSPYMAVPMGGLNASFFFVVEGDTEKRVGYSLWD